MTGTWMRRGAVALAAGVAAAVAGVLGSSPAGAGGGDWMHPVRDRYEAGQDVLMVGYVSTSAPIDASTGPYYAWLRVDPAAERRAEAAATGPYVDPADIRVAPVVIEPVAVDDPWYGQRATISFTLPQDLAPGHYTTVLCNDPCTRAPGYLYPDALSVGVTPTYEIVRGWPASEPAIRWLEDDALLFAPDGQMVRAADYRAGRFPPPTTLPGPAPAAVPATVAEAPASRVAGAARSGVPGEAPVMAARPAPVASGPTDGPAADDDGLLPLGVWLGALGLLAIVSAALLTRRRGAWRAATPGPAAAAEAGATEAAADERSGQLVRT